MICALVSADQRRRRPVPCNHLDPTDVPSVRVRRMVIHMGKPIPMKESESSRITIARLCGEEITLTLGKQIAAAKIVDREMR